MWIGGLVGWWFGRLVEWKLAGIGGLVGWWSGLVDGLDWWVGLVGGFGGSEVCKSSLARATAMGRRILLFVFP